MGFNMKDYAKNLGLKTVLSYLDSDPIANMPKVLEWVKRFDSENHYEKVYKKLDEVLSNPDNVWHRYIVSLYSDIDSDVRKKLFNNFLLNSAIEGTSKKRKAEAKYDCNIPWAILMDPTSACNLKCKGCWAAEYGNKLNMDLKTLDSIITQGKKLGTYMYIYSGGEPLIRKDDIITLCRKHNDCAFLAFTNSTLIDENFAKQMLSVKNFIPAISIEGYEEETDFRRGEGTYKATIRAMEVLKKYKLPFGISCCYTSTNTDIIGSEEYIDDMISKGAKFAWFFTYMFDLILSHEVIEHVVDDRRCIAEIVRTLKPGGRLVLFCPNRGYPFETHGIYRRGTYEFGNKLFVNYLPRPLRDRLCPHVNVYTDGDLRKLFAGLPVRFVRRTVLFGAYDNLIARFGTYKDEKQPATDKCSRWT